MTPTLDRNLNALRASGYPVPAAATPPAGWELDAAAETIEDAERQVAAQPLTDKHAVAVVAGAGLGFVVDAVSARRADLPIVVSESSFTGLVPFLCRRDWSRDISEGRLGLFWPDSASESRGLRRMLEAREGEMFVLPHPVRLQRDGKALAATIAAFWRFWGGARANRAARLAFEAPYADNTLANLSRLDGMLNLRAMAGLTAGSPAVVVAAGPSLDAQLEDIRRVRKSVVLISVDTALRPLLAANLDPDFVVAVDPQPLNAEHLIDLAPDTHARLVSELSLPPEVFEAYGKRIAPFRVGLNEPWPWLVSHGVDLAVLAAWGSVLVTTIDLACHLGCNPVLLCAADLAYTGGRPYCRHTTFGRNAAAHGETEDQLAARWMTLVDENLVTMEDIKGQPTRTPSHFPTVRDAIVELASRRHDRVFVNTTGAGILAGGRILQGRLRDTVRQATNGARVLSIAGKPLPRLSTDLHHREDELKPEWHQLVASLGMAWPALNATTGAGPVAVLRSVLIARQRPDAGLPVSFDACVRWMSPLLDAPWSGEVLRVVQALDAALPQWFDLLEPVFARALDTREAEPGTYARLALWVTRTAGDALHLPPVADFVTRVVSRLLEVQRAGTLKADTQADLALLMLSSRGPAADADPIITTVRDQLGDRSLVTEALAALSIKARTEALIAGSAQLAPELSALAQTWAELDIGDGRDRAATYRPLIHLTACSGDVTRAEHLLREGLAKHPALAEACGVLALECWLSHEATFARTLLDCMGEPATPTPPLLFQMAVAHALLGDPQRARELFARLHETAPWFFRFTVSPNNRWFFLARAAAALGDRPLAEAAGRTARRWDPLADRREAVAPVIDSGMTSSGDSLPRFDLPAEPDEDR